MAFDSPTRQLSDRIAEGGFSTGMARAWDALSQIYCVRSGPGCHSVGEANNYTLDFWRRWIRIRRTVRCMGIDKANGSTAIVRTWLSRDGGNVE